jgi:hypothetical protein
MLFNETLCLQKGRYQSPFILRTRERRKKRRRKRLV